MGRPPSLSISPAKFTGKLSSTSSPVVRQPNSPYNYIQIETPISEKSSSSSSFHVDSPPRRPHSAGPSGARPHTPRTATPLQQSRVPTPLIIPPYQQSLCRARPRALLFKANLLKSWAPLLMYGASSLGFLVAIAWWRDEVFAGLDELSQWLRADEHYGQAVLFFLIFLTTFPPIPLYSTLIILSGYTFGAWGGALLSYGAALSGALTVFILSRTFFRRCIAQWLTRTTTIRRVIRAVEKRPRLLFLIRLAPYPYNVMNVLLAASPSLTLKTYTVCTALSLFKVIVHTSLGASIHSFKAYNKITKEGEDPAAVDDDEEAAHLHARILTVVGAILCIAIFVYLSVVARRAVDDEMENEVEPARDCEEAVAFLAENGLSPDERQPRTMTESPFRPLYLGASSTARRSISTTRPTTPDVTMHTGVDITSPTQHHHHASTPSRHQFHRLDSDHHMPGSAVQPDTPR